MYRVLIVGGSGLVGKAIFTEMNNDKEFDVYGTYFNNPVSLHAHKFLQFAVTDPFNISTIWTNLRPQIVISCLRGDYDYQLVLHRLIAEYLKKNDGRLYFCSTANVFDNDFSKPHYESDLPNTRSRYGQFKIECERILSEILHDNACILRLPPIWAKGSPRMNTLMNSLSNNGDIQVYPKLFYTLNTDLMLARQLCYIIKKRLNGIFHLATEDIISQRDFYYKLILGLGNNNVKMQEDLNEKGYFALSSNRFSEFPEFLRLTTDSVVNYLTEL